MNQENEKSSKKRGLLFWIIIGLTTTNVITIWLLVNEKSKVANTITISEKILVEKNTVEVDLVNLQKDYQNLQTNDAAMQLDIDAKRARIEVLIKEASRHKGDATIISKLKIEMQTLRSIMQSYVRTIDSLNTLNQTLVAEKKTVLKQLGSEKEKQSVLIKEKDELKSTIAKGSILSCFNISAKAVLYKRGGKKESETNKARKTEKIKVSFSLGENKIAKAGEKTIYVRIMTPDGKELSKNYDDNSRFNFNQRSGYFAGRETLNYANSELNGVTYCEGQGEYVPGNYIIEITCDGVVIGNTTLKLD